MKKSRLINTAAILALMAGLGSPVFAQDAQEGKQEGFTQAQNLTPELEALSLTDPMERPGRNGERIITGIMVNGDKVGIRLDSDGKLIAIGLKEGALPLSVVEKLLPKPVMSNSIIPQYHAIQSIRTGENHYDIRGQDLAGDDIRAEIDQAGRLMRFGRNDPDNMHAKKKGERGEGRKKDHHGKKDDKHKGPKRKHHEADGPGEIPFDTVKVQKSLTDAGYSDFGFLQMKGPHIMIDATNPQKETVTLELDQKGEVVNETRR